MPLYAGFGSAIPSLVILTIKTYILSPHLQVSRLRRIHDQEFSSETNSRISFVSYLLDVPSDLVHDYFEVHQKAAEIFFSVSKQKLSAVVRFLLDAGFR